MKTTSEKIIKSRLKVSLDWVLRVLWRILLKLFAWIGNVVYNDILVVGFVY